MINVLHVGPHVDSFGGTQSVIRVIRDHHVGADEIVAVPTWDGPNHARNAKLTLGAGATITRTSPDTIVHFHITNATAWLREGSLIQLARNRGRRIVVTLHGSRFPEFARAHPRFVTTGLAHADQLICLSDEAHDVLARLLPSKPVTVLANPVAIDAGAPPADRTPPVALFAGTIGLRKGVDVLVEAWRRLLSQGAAGQCRIVGPITDFIPPRLERLIVGGPVHPSRVHTLVRESRVVVLPSRAEGMPMILAEALATGRPFVATPVGGTRTITPDPEMLVPVGDPDALAEAIGRYLVDGTLAAQAGERGRQHIIETRSPAVIDARLRAIYGAVG